MKLKNKKIIFPATLLIFIASLLIGIGNVNSQSAHKPEVVNNIPHVKPRLEELLRPRNVPNFNHNTLDPCPNPEREPRFIYRENVVHEERQFRAEHTGCGGDILMRKWQIVGLEIGSCDELSYGPDCDVEWLDEYVAYYDRYIPEEKGVVFDKVGSWQKAWPLTDLPENAASEGAGGTNPNDAWRTEKQLMEEYGEPVPFPACQSDCLQAPPGVPGKLGDHDQEDPYYFNNPWLPEIAGGEIPDNIEYFRKEKNILGGENALDAVPLPTKIFWWNVPGWHDGWIENGELKECEGPEDIACVNSYIIRFDNINREDRPPKLYRFQTVYKVKKELLENYPGEYNDVEAYKRAQKIFDDLDRAFKEAYEKYRRHIKDTRSVDILRYDRDNIMYCDECGGELEIWLDKNTFNPLDYDPIIDYEREHREWMEDYLLDKLEDENGHMYQVVTKKEQEDFINDLIKEEFASYGRPAFFRSGAEQSYSLQATCSPHDYLEKSSEMEKGEGRWGPRSTFSFLTHDGPELISPLDPNWVSPYEPKDYEPNHNESRVVAGEDHEHYGNERIDGYEYPKESLPDKEINEKKGLSELNPQEMKNLWNENFDNLILQDLVPFREDLEWAQIWYNQNPDKKLLHPAAPAEMYQLSLGKSYRVPEIDKPVLEWCHPQLTKTFKARPICNYFKNTLSAGEQDASFAMPIREDRTVEYFFLPEDDEEEEKVYSWSVAACQDQAEDNCTNYSQMWRFQIDQNEENRLFAPRSLNPANIKLDQVEDDKGTVGFPFYIEWDRYFGIETYVYRLRKKGDSNWDNPIDAAIQNRREIRYDLSDIKKEVLISHTIGSITTGIFELDTEYEWDIKACWDEKVDHGKTNPKDILDWAEENKSETCTDWRSEEFVDDAPFQFKTTGRPPEEVSPIDSGEAKYPINFQWENVPGAKSYALSVYKGSTSGGGGVENAEMGIITPETNFEFLLDIELNDFLIWKIESCADGIDETEFYFPSGSSYFSLQEGKTLDKFTTDKAQLHCHDTRGSHFFNPYLPGPEKLQPGTISGAGYDPEIILVEDSIKTISWEKIKGVDYYKVSISPAGESPAYEKLIKDNNLIYDFAELGEGAYELEVRGCLKRSSTNPDECAENMLGQSSTPRQVKVTNMDPNYDGLVRGVIPCGTQVDNPNLEDLDTTESCRPIHLFIMFKLIIQEILFKLIMPFSLVFLLIYTGYLYYTGLGDPKTMRKVFKVWEYALKGYLLILLSWVIVSVFLVVVGYQVDVFGEWWKI